MYYYKTANGGYVHTSYPIVGGQNDGHGGHGYEHRAMMEAIANEIVDRKLQMLLPELQKNAFNKAYQQFVQDLKFDVDTAVNLSFADGEKVLLDRKTQEMVADHIVAEIEKQLNGASFKI